MYAGPRRASRSPPQLQRAALHSPTSEQELGQVHSVGNISSPLEVAGESLRLARDHDVASVAERVESEHSRVPIGREDRVREPTLEDRTAGVVERARKVRDRGRAARIVEDGERGVEAVEARVDEAQRD